MSRIMGAITCVGAWAVIIIGIFHHVPLALWFLGGGLVLVTAAVGLSDPAPATPKQPASQGNDQALRDALQRGAKRTGTDPFDYFPKQ